MTPKRILIVGGVAGGASAAAKARREDEHADIVIYERGPYISFANCGLPYFLSGEIQDRESLLVMTPEELWARYRIRAWTGHEVLGLDRSTRTLAIRKPDGKTVTDRYDKLILSQGAMPVVPPFKGVDQDHVFILRDIPDMDRIHRFLTERQPKSAVIIGGGFIGLEMAEAFFHRQMAVTVIEKSAHILPLLDSDMAMELQEKVGAQGLNLRTGIGAKEFTRHSVLLEDGSEIPADFILLSVGVRPEVKLARDAGLEIGRTGGVMSNGRMESSDPDIYVVGDAAETTHLITGARIRIPLAGPANRQGRVAGANAAGAHLTYPGTLGTSIVRILKTTVGYVGINSAQAREAGYSFFSSMTRNASHASYYPGASTLITKIIVEEGTGRLLGAQVMGERGVDKRVDVLATAIYGKMKVTDLESLDLAYAPPFGSANDPVNYAAFVASHEVQGDVRLQDPEKLAESDAFLLDVRDADELEEHGRLKGAIHIPLPELRERLEEIPRDRKIVVYCQKGQRGYLATRILTQRGFDKVCNLKGGFLQAKALGAAREASSPTPPNGHREPQSRS